MQNKVTLKIITESGVCKELEIQFDGKFIKVGEDGLNPGDTLQLTFSKPLFSESPPSEGNESDAS
jgi:hypothetical protein